MKHFAPIVEIGCGANAYWANLMNNNKIDVVAFDTSLDDGGKIKSNTDDDGGKNKTKKRKHDDIALMKQLPLHHGGPEVLSSEKWTNCKIIHCINFCIYFIYL